MMGAWDVRQLLDRKYAIMERENAIKAQEATSAGILRGAQARGMDVTTGLAPALSQAEIAERNARALGLTTEAGLAPKIAQSGIDLNTARIGSETAGQRLTRAQAGLAGAQAGLVGAQTTGEGMLNQYNRDVFGRNASTAPRAAGLASLELDPLNGSTQRNRFSLERSLQPSMRGGFGMVQY